MLPNLERIINFAREQDMPIIWTQSDHSAPFGGVMLKKFPTIREDGRVMTTEDLLDEMRNELGRNDRVAAE
jgi:nicotinamidase-related amidase